MEDQLSKVHFAPFLPRPLAFPSVSLFFVPCRTPRTFVSGCWCRWHHCPHCMWNERLLMWRIWRIGLPTMDSSSCFLAHGFCFRSYRPQRSAAKLRQRYASNDVEGYASGTLFKQVLKRCMFLWCVACWCGIEIEQTGFKNVFSSLFHGSPFLPFMSSSPQQQYHHCCFVLLKDSSSSLTLLEWQAISSNVDKRWKRCPSLACCHNTVQLQ